MKVKNVFFHGYKSGKMLGFADIQFSIYDGDEGLVTIKGWKVFENDDGIGVQAPATKKDGKAGPEYFPTIVFTKDSVSEDFLNEIKIRVQKAVARSGSEEKKPQKKAATAVRDRKPQPQDFDEDDDCPF
jgi:hypothetical protein